MSQDQWKAERFAVCERIRALHKLLDAIDLALEVGALDDPLPVFVSQTVDGDGGPQPSGAPAWLAEGSSEEPPSVAAVDPHVGGSSE